MALVVAFFGVLAGIGADDMEGILFPVAGPLETHHITVEGPRKVCWSMSFTKLRADAKPVVFVWFIQLADTSKRYQLYQEGDYGPISSDVTSKVGTASYHWCASTLVDVTGKSFSISAYARYSVWHNLWDVPRTIPPFKSDNT